MQVNIGVNNPEQINDLLSTYLATQYTLYLKTQKFHWNVTGPQFHSLHEMFEEQYIDLRDAIDDIAERIRALGSFAPGSLTKFSELSKISDHVGDANADTMVKILLEDNEMITRLGREMIEKIEQHNDHVTADMLIGRTEVHEKTAWMLRSLLA